MVVLIIFPVILQAVISLIMQSNGGQGIEWSETIGSYNTPHTAVGDWRQKQITK